MALSRGKPQVKGLCKSCGKGITTTSTRFRLGGYCGLKCSVNAPPVAWSQDIAYLSGLIASDGCLHEGPRTRRISFCSTDWSLYQSSLNLLERNGYTPVTSSRIPKGGNRAYHWSLSDPELHSRLVAIGLTPRKSLTLRIHSLPKDDHGHNHFWAFFRGVFEGDGTIGLDSQTKVVSDLSITCGSKIFLEWLESELYKRGFYRTSIIPDHASFALIVSRTEVHRLYHYMYATNTSSDVHGHLSKRTRLANRPLPIYIHDCRKKAMTLFGIIRAFRYCESKLGRSPTFSEYKAMRKDAAINCPGMYFPPFQRVHKKFHSWQKATEFVERYSQLHPQGPPSQRVDLAFPTFQELDFTPPNNPYI